jgi:hypothetical protein
LLSNFIISLGTKTKNFDGRSRIGLTCREYKEGYWFDYLTHLDTKFLVLVPNLLHRLKTHHKRLTSLQLAECQYEGSEVLFFLAELFPQLSSLYLKAWDQLPDAPSGPVFFLEDLERVRLKHLKIGFETDFMVNRSGTISLLQWIRSGLPRLETIDITINSEGHVKEALDALKDGCSILRRLKITIGQKCAAPTLLLHDSILGICKASFKTLTSVKIFHTPFLSGTLRDLTFDPNRLNLIECQQRCLDLYGVTLSDFRVCYSTLWDEVFEQYVINTEGQKIVIEDLDPLFDMCFISWSQKYKTIYNLMRQFKRNSFPEVAAYCVKKILSWVPNACELPTKYSVQSLVESILLCDAATELSTQLQLVGALRTALTTSPDLIIFVAHLPVALLLSKDSKWLKNSGVNLARITDDHRSFSAALLDPPSLLALLEICGTQIFHCSTPYHIFLSTVVLWYFQSSSSGSQQILQHLVKLHYSHQQYNYLLDRYFSNLPDYLPGKDVFEDIVRSIFDIPVSAVPELAPFFSKT